MKQRVLSWMRATVGAVASAVQSSVKRLPMQFGRTEELPPLSFTPAEQSQSGYDGGSDLDVIRARKDEIEQKGQEVPEVLEYECTNGDPESWRKPNLPLRDADGVEVVAGAPAPPKPSIY